MARHARFQVSKTKSGWKVNVPMSLSATGKRQELFFPSRDKALVKAAALRESQREHGKAVTKLPPAVLDDATRAWALIEPLGITLTQLARQHVASVDRDARTVALAKALEAWQETWEKRLRDDTVKSYKMTAAKLLAIGGEVLLTRLDPLVVSQVISGASHSMHRRNTSAFLNWCSKPPRRWLDAKGVLSEMEAAESKLKDGEIGTLTPELAGLLLHTAEQCMPRAVGRYAMALFSGMRAEEIGKLDPAAVSKEGIEVGAEIAKKRRRRFIPMNEALRAWLTAYPFEQVENWEQRDAAIRRLCGWDVTSKLLEDPPVPTLGRWPKNALRHTHASAEIASGATLEDLLFRFGHTDGPEMLKSHYVGRYTVAQAAKLKALRPQ